MGRPAGTGPLVFVNQVTTKRTITAEQLSSSSIGDDEEVRELNLIKNDRHWEAAGE